MGLWLGGDAGPGVGDDLRAQPGHHGAGGLTERDGEDGHEDDDERRTPHADPIHPSVND